MHNLIKAILLIFFINLGLTSNAQTTDTATQDPTITDGTYVEKHDNGNIKIKGTYKNGLKDGLWKEFAEEGWLQKATKYKRGKVKSIIEYNQEGKMTRFTDKNGKVKDIEDCGCKTRAN